jgi:hypothetical protein
MAEKGLQLSILMLPIFFSVTDSHYMISTALHASMEDNISTVHHLCQQKNSEDPRWRKKSEVS